VEGAGVVVILVVVTLGFFVVVKLETNREIDEVVVEAFVEYATVEVESRLVGRVDISPSSKKISLSK
jgi:hypothetical protein